MLSPGFAGSPGSSAISDRRPGRGNLADAGRPACWPAPPSARQTSEPAHSIILLWLPGGPSQLETFDPHPGTAIAAGTRAIATAVKGVQLAHGLPRTAEQMGSVALIRSMVSKEGDHERGTYTMKTGFRPDPTVVHPVHRRDSAATNCQPPASISRAMSASCPSQWPARGGFLGEQYDAFQTDDPASPVPDTVTNVPTDRDEQRQRHLEVVESAFARGRASASRRRMHRATMAAARQMMSSEQLKAFDVLEASRWLCARSMATRPSAAAAWRPGG